MYSRSRSNETARALWLTPLYGFGPKKTPHRTPICGVSPRNAPRHLNVPHCEDPDCHQYRGKSTFINLIFVLVYYVRLWMSSFMLKSPPRESCGAFFEGPDLSFNLFRCTAADQFKIVIRLQI